MKRQAVTPKPASPAQAAPAPTNPASAAGAATTPKRNWMGPIAGLAAGLGIAALLSHFGLGEGMANIVMIALLAMAAVFVFKLFRRRSPVGACCDVPGEPMQFAGAGVTTTPPLSQLGTAHLPFPLQPTHIPDGFDTEDSCVAKLNFIQMQAANDAKNLEDIREFVSPEVFAEIKMQMDERGSAPQQNRCGDSECGASRGMYRVNRHVASVHFSGTISEVAGEAAVPFDEVWNLSKPIDGGGWIVAGIQQLS
ncbi:MAG: Tim44 domain-containing protein [Propionivibrio sp.]|nr:Tim44 domain-containing protein [Propionivibrio sp.]